MKTMNEKEALQAYNEFLDEVYGNIKICGLDYQASHALKLVDNVAYDCGFSDWTDSEGIEVE